MKKEILLVDGHGLAFRGFYALPDTLAANDGTPTNAVLGFANMLLKGLDKWKVDGLGLFFDPKGPTRRNELFKEYKEGRKPTPEGFKAQLPLIIELSRAMGFPVFIKEGLEADDYIVSTARRAAEEGYSIKILSADKDLLQIINSDITVIRPTKGVSDFRLYDEVFFRNEFGFAPASMADYLALVGDSVDNIPGVPGIGEKTAKVLIAEFGTLEQVYDNLDSMPRGRRTKLEENMDLAYNSRSLILPIESEAVPPEMLIMQKPDNAALNEICSKLGLLKLIKRFGLIRTDAFENSGQNDGPIAEAVIPEVITEPAAYIKLEEILKDAELAAAPDDGQASMAVYIAGRQGRMAKLRLSDAEDLNAWKKWCEKGILTLFGYRGMLVDGKFDIPGSGRIRDVETAHYLLHPDRGGKAIEKTLGYKIPGGEKLAGILFGLWDAFYAQMKEYGLLKLMYEIDMPLCPVLARLQRKGIFADADRLESLESELVKKISITESEITDMAGEKINLNSPKQVGQLLFEHLKLPPIKKTQTGYSTDMSVLEELSRLPAPLCDVPMKIIDYREQSKILSGFVQPFLFLASKGDGRIHSTFDHLSTGTGRLASRDPNVQNMPVFGEWGVKFRDCFLPSGDGRIFVAADYSQIELRVLAHLSGEERLINAFKEERDVHMETASWVFGLPPEDITPEQRRFAKVVNFGLLYGMSAHGLSQRLGVSRQMAASMVERYFSVLPKVRKYLESSLRQAKEAGYTRSIFGRIRPLKEVATVEGRGNNPIDRVAVNTPIQSAASDIAKIALVKFDKVISEEFTEAYTVLQIHDSIVCECRTEDMQKIEKRLVEVMESVNVLSVPVKAEPKHGTSLSYV